MNKPTEIKRFPGQLVDRHLAQMGALPDETQFTAMSAHQILETCGADASKWAAAFCQHARKLGYSPMDQGWVLGWFANAIEKSTDLRMGRGKTRQ